MKQFNHQSDIFELSAIRRRILLSVFVLTFIGLFFKAVYLLHAEKENLQKRGNNLSVRNEVLQSYRGKIYDRNNELLAVSILSFDLGINKYRDINKESEKYEQLARILNIPKKEISRIEKNNQNKFFYLKRTISAEQAKEISNLKITGIVLEKNYKRFYPGRESAAHIIGRMNIDGKGSEGLEKQFDNLLSGEQGYKKVLVDGKKRIVDDLKDIKLAKDGSDIKITIDRRLQHQTYQALMSQVEKHDADSGSAVLIDAKSGEILAMSNYPSYNPNASVKNFEFMKNRVLVDVFEPGSTMKPFAISAALELKKLDHNEIIPTPGGFIEVSGKKIRDDHPHDSYSVREVIKYSSNVGASKIGYRVEPEKLWSFYDKLGFGKKVNVNLPGETSGFLRAYNRWMESDHYRINYGYSINVNVLQLAQAYTVFANSGSIIKPKLIIDNNTATKSEKVFSDKTANLILGDLVSVVHEKGGTGNVIKIPGYVIAGKTGTAHKYVNGSYDRGYYSSFVGLAPAKDPKFIMAVVIDNPKAISHYGGAVAGPVFKTVIKDALKLYDIPNDENLTMFGVKEEEQAVTSSEQSI